MFNDSVQTFVTFQTKISNFLPLEVGFSVAFIKANYTRVFAMGYTSLISVQVRQEIKTSEIAVGVHFCLEDQARHWIQQNCQGVSSITLITITTRNQRMRLTTHYSFPSVLSLVFMSAWNTKQDLGFMWYSKDLCWTLIIFVILLVWRKVNVLLQLLSCFAIPMVLLLSWFYLKSR